MDDRTQSYRNGLPGFSDEETDLTPSPEVQPAYTIDDDDDGLDYLLDGGDDGSDLLQDEDDFDLEEYEDGEFDLSMLDEKRPSADDDDDKQDGDREDDDDEFWEDEMESLDDDDDDEGELESYFQGDDDVDNY